MGPDGSQGFDVYLRTAVSVDPGGWAHFDYVKMPDYRWGIFLAPAGRPIARSTSASTRASRRGRRSRASTATTLRRIIVTQGDTEPASVEQQRHLGLTVPHRCTTCATSSRSTSRRGGTSGRWSTCCTRYFGRDGREEAEALLERRSRRRRQAAHPRRVQRADARLARRSSCSPSSPTATASSSSRALAESGFDPLARTTQASC